MPLPFPPPPPPWSCATLRRQSARVAADELPPADAASARAHLDACPGCRRAVERERNFVARLRAVRDPAVASTALRARIAAALARGDRPDS